MPSQFPLDMIIIYLCVCVCGGGLVFYFGVRMSSPGSGIVEIQGIH